MAKTIKFNLVCDNKPIRTLEDLRNNFSIEDVLEYYHNKLLHRWLSVRGYSEELKKVESITEHEDLPLIKSLINIFEVEFNQAIIEKETYILGYKKERKFIMSEYEKQSYKASSIIDDYHAGYQQLIDTIIENKTDIGKIKAAIKEIDNHYSCLYELDYRNLFYMFGKLAPTAIFVMLMNEHMRQKYLPIQTIGEDRELVTDLDIDTDKKNMYTALTSMLNGGTNAVRIFKFLPSGSDSVSEIIGENLLVFSGVTDGYWKDVEPKGKRYLILKMESGNFIRSAGESGGDMDSSAVNNQFVILNGIDYKSNNADHKLLYMEV